MMDLMNMEQDPDNEITDRERLGYQIVHTRKPHKDAPNGGYLVTADDVPSGFLRHYSS